MIENKEIAALFHLIDDPDEDVFHSVSDRLVSFGRGIIPNLEDLSDNTMDKNLQDRIQLIIHKLNFRDLQNDFAEWKKDDGELISGALLASKFLYPDQQANQTLHEVEKIRRNIWLELNSYLTSLEQIGVISGILFGYYKIQGNEISYDLPEDFLVTKLLENKRGNAISSGILYLSLCQMLDVPVKAIQIPKQFILAYYDSSYKYTLQEKSQDEKISFFIDPLNGQVYSQKDVKNYFKRISVPSIPAYYRPLNNHQVIGYALEELAKCYEAPEQHQKNKDLLFLAKLLSD